MFCVCHTLLPTLGTVEHGEAVKYVECVPGGEGNAAVSTAFASGRFEETSISSGARFGRIF